MKLNLMPKPTAFQRFVGSLENLVKPRDRSIKTVETVSTTPINPLETASIPPWKPESGNSIFAQLGVNASLERSFFALEEEVKSSDKINNLLSELKYQYRVESPSEVVAALNAMNEVGHLSSEFENHFVRLGRWISLAVICREDLALGFTIKERGCKNEELLTSVPQMLVHDNGIREFISDNQKGQAQKSERMIFSGILDILTQSDSLNTVTPLKDDSKAIRIIFSALTAVEKLKPIIDLAPTSTELAKDQKLPISVIAENPKHNIPININLQKLLAKGSKSLREAESELQNPSKNSRIAWLTNCADIFMPQVNNNHITELHKVFDNDLSKNQKQKVILKTSRYLRELSLVESDITLEAAANSVNNSNSNTFLGHSRNWKIASQHILTVQSVFAMVTALEVEKLYSNTN